MTKKKPKNTPHQTTHLGYVCTTRDYATTKPYVHAVLDMVKLPDWVSGDIRERLPHHVIWPVPNHTQVHDCIDNLIEMNAPALEHIRARWPDHVFAFEDYLTWCWLHEEQQQQGHDPSMVVIPTATQPLQAEHISSLLLLGGTVSWDMELYRFPDGDAWVVWSLRWKGHPKVSRDLLARAYVDPVTERIYLTHWYGGRHRGLRIDPDLVRQVWGVPHHEVYEREPRAGGTVARARSAGRIGA